MNQREEHNMDTYASNRRIEELLNSFVDGELTQREATEVERLIADDARIAQRLRELQKSKMLVGSLPRSEAPAEMADEIKASLERRTLLVQSQGGRPSAQAERFDEPRPFEGLDERTGARHLLVRKVLAAAAMVGLVAILAAVVYTIVAPESVPPTAGFRGRLELKTSNVIAVNSFIKKAIEDNGLKYSSPGSQGDKSIYALSCSREDLSSLLADLDNIWERFNSTTLFVETKTPGKEVVVDGVSAEQIADLITPQKPRVLGGEETIEKPAIRAADVGKVHLTIVVGGSK